MSETPPANPFASPRRAGPSGARRSGRWSASFKLSLIGAGLMLGSVGFLAVGVVHYSHLQRGFDYDTQSSQELAQITASAWWWLVPTLACLLGGVITLAASLACWLKSLLAG